jgi:hypothetical protein
MSYFRSRPRDSRVPPAAGGGRPESRELGVQDPLDEAFHLLRPLRELCEALARGASGLALDSRRAVLLTAFGAHWANLRCRSAAAGRPFPLGELAAEAGLDEAETALLVYLVEESLARRPCVQDELESLVAAPGLSGLGPGRLSPGSRLVEGGIVKVCDPWLELGVVCLTETARARLAGQEPPSPELGLRALLAEDGLLELLATDPALPELVLEPGLAERLEELAGSLREETEATLARWGVAELGRCRGRTLLFCGAPGTGKSLAARSLAARLGAPLLRTDCARVLSRWVGESQQNTARLFQLYRKAAGVLGRRPLLLLDEADQLLGRRQGGGEAVDRMHHQMQNLLLEALDSFDGLLVATTNLPEALDPAFLRRFDAKLEFTVPGPVERRRLWDLALPAAVPRLEELDLDGLARHPLSGGQVALAARAALRSAARRGDGLRRADLERAAQRERRGAEVGGGRESIGFGRA